MINFLITIPRRIWNFLKDVKIEMKKVKWPTRRETFRGAFLVILFSIITAFIIGGFDFLFRFILDKFIL